MEMRGNSVLVSPHWADLFLESTKIRGTRSLWSPRHSQVSCSGRFTSSHYRDDLLHPSLLTQTPHTLFVPFMIPLTFPHLGLVHPRVSESHFNHLALFKVDTELHSKTVDRNRKQGEKCAEGGHELASSFLKYLWGNLCSNIKYF